MNSGTTSQTVSTALAHEIRAFASGNGLTPRETEIFGLLVEGVVRIKDVASRLDLSPNTVNNHINSIFMKTKSRSKSQLLAGFLNAVAEELSRARRFERAPRVILLDCDPAHAEELTKTLMVEGCVVERCSARAELDARLSKFAPDFIFADHPENPADTKAFASFVNQHLPARVYFMSKQSSAVEDPDYDVVPKPIVPAQLFHGMFDRYSRTYARPR